MSTIIFTGVISDFINLFVINLGDLALSSTSHSGINRYSGLAFGLGIERFAMLAYQIKDLRVFFENDINFLEQFENLRES